VGNITLAISETRAFEASKNRPAEAEAQFLQNRRNVQLPERSLIVARGALTEILEEHEELRRCQDALKESGEFAAAASSQARRVEGLSI